MTAIDGLAAEPRPVGARLLSGTSDERIWRLTVGDYRILYQVSHSITARGAGAVVHVAAGRSTICERFGAFEFERNHSLVADDPRVVTGLDHVRVPGPCFSLAAICVGNVQATADDRTDMT